MQFQVNIQTGLLEPVNYQPSPHCDARPIDSQINLIVIHGISLPPGKFGSTAIEQFFCGKLNYSLHPYFATIQHLQVSAHLLVNRNGEITQFVPFHQRAWHAGESFFQGKTRCNDFSIGIELEGTDDLPYEEVQYQQLRKAVSAIMHAYPAISTDHIVGHSDIAPGRKTDPGLSFDWQYFKRNLL